jgi:hypothetical protein
MSPMSGSTTASFSAPAQAHHSGSLHGGHGHCHNGHGGGSGDGSGGHHEPPG